VDAPSVLLGKARRHPSTSPRTNAYNRAPARAVPVTTISARRSYLMAWAVAMMALRAW